jgi:hypothetical protein
MTLVGRRWLLVGVSALAVTACSGSAGGTSPAVLHSGDCVNLTLPPDPLGPFPRNVDRLDQRPCSEGQWVVLATSRRSASDSPDLHPACSQVAAETEYSGLQVVGDFETPATPGAPVVKAVSVPERHDDPSSQDWLVCLAPPSHS